MNKSGSMGKCCYVVILNYNSWQDTIECLESVLKSDYFNFKIIVCDNNSSNDSIEHMISWANGKEKVSFSMNSIIQNAVLPILKKPVHFACYSETTDSKEQFTKLVNFIKISRNKGFAGGMNIGIKAAMRQSDCGYIWCLNNDTVVDRAAMRLMIETIEGTNNIGICSSRTFYYLEPETEQWLIHKTGFNKWLCISAKISDEELEKQLMASYNGASFIVTPNFIRKVGMMEEKYFLYCEEWDWTIRGKKQGFKLAFAPDSIVYHKQGKTTGGTENKKSIIADYYGVRSKILFTRKFYPYCIPTVYLGLLIAIINRIRRKQYKRIWMILKLMLNPKPLFRAMPEREKR